MCLSGDKLIENPARHDVAEGRGEVGRSTVSGIAFDSRNDGRGAGCGGVALAGWEAGLFRREDGWDSEFSSLLVL